MKGAKSHAKDTNLTGRLRSTAYSWNDGNGHQIRASHPAATLTQFVQSKFREVLTPYIPGPFKSVVVIYIETCIK